MKINLQFYMNGLNVRRRLVVTQLTFPWSKSKSVIETLVKGVNNVQS